MADITFLGLGLMGAALAETMIKAGHETVVWNRTPTKAEPLVALGAKQAANVPDAISQSPITVVCVGDYDNSDSILRTPEALEALNGRLLVQLSSGSSRLAKAAQVWVSQAGATYLDGGIMSFPSDIGTSRAMFVLSGQEQSYKQAEPFLRLLAPKLEYLGDDPGLASAMDSAMLSTAFGLIFGVMNGAALCEATGISIKQFIDITKYRLPLDFDTISESALKCQDDSFEEPEASLNTWAATLGPMVETLEDSGYNPEIPTFMKSVLHRVIDQGLGEQDIGALIKVLRPQ